MPSFAEPVGLFPLPNAVLLPGGALPLQVFEDRYRAMVSDAIEDRGIIAMALLQPGYEPVYHTNKAEIHPVVCVGKINDHVQIPDGRYFINLLGLCRARIRQEDRDGEYRTAMLDPMLPTGSGIEIDGEFAARSSLRDVLGLEEIEATDVIQRARGLVDSELPLGELVDRVASALLPTEMVELKQRLLEEMNPIRRAGILTHELHTLVQVMAVRQKDLDRWPRFGSMN
ncbi:MAG: LON peptidase substrate-binding domain-containing protein [Planctomycetes bacterium]|nr:LON peptidase substrate-binding domain-containing protein [Planctomycetota bacterium]